MPRRWWPACRRRRRWRRKGVSKRGIRAGSATSTTSYYQCWLSTALLGVSHIAVDRWISVLIRQRTSNRGTTCWRTLHSIVSTIELDIWYIVQRAGPNARSSLAVNSMCCYFLSGCLRRGPGLADLAREKQICSLKQSLQYVIVSRYLVLHARKVRWFGHDVT